MKKRSSQLLSHSPEGKCYHEMPQAFIVSLAVLLVKKFVLTLSNAVHNLPGHLEASGQARRK